MLPGLTEKVAEKSLWQFVYTQLPGSQSRGPASSSSSSSFDDFWNQLFFILINLILTYSKSVQVDFWNQLFFSSSTWYYRLFKVCSYVSHRGFRDSWLAQWKMMGKWVHQVIAGCWKNRTNHPTHPTAIAATAAAPQEPKDAVEVDLDDMDIEEAAAWESLASWLMILACGLQKCVLTIQNICL